VELTTQFDSASFALAMQINATMDDFDATLPALLMAV
jgi:hypothetical protein